MIAFWSYKNEYNKYNSKLNNFFNQTLKSGQIFFGHNLKKFEYNFIRKYKSKYGIAVGSGTDALLISLMSLNLKKNDEIITASNTAIPTISAIVNSGAKPVLVDINEDYLIDTDKIEKKITKKTRAIIPVHLYGQSCDMNKIIKIAKKYKLEIIEDCAQSQGAKFKNKFVGTFGSFGCFSFYPTKILGGYSDGGFILTNNYKYYSAIKKIRFYGIDTVDKKNKFYNKYYSNLNGINSRLDEINSKILDFKLKKIDYFISRRRFIANIYNSELKNTKLILPYLNKDKFDVFHLYTVYHKKRDLIMKKLLKQKIQTRIIYPYPIHKMKGYSFLFKKEKYKISEAKSKGIFSLPLYPELDIKRVKIICKKLKKILLSIEN
ncbi:DegT/DnrJ/EryC1/StrS family aminotransferase [Candidatus Pelagibacter sp.]|nr:DegT/DnrJ/EryC1/StrS family aminotransferase [Candidatus Pelagibacter sp.]